MNRFQSTVWYAVMACNTALAVANTYFMVKVVQATSKVPGLLERLIEVAGG